MEKKILTLALGRELKGFKAYGSSKKLFTFLSHPAPLAVILGIVSTLDAVTVLMAPWQ